jgi:hypothetical protein
MRPAKEMETEVARDFLTKERRGSENSGGGVMGVIVFCSDYAKRIRTRGGGASNLFFQFSAFIFSGVHQPNITCSKSIHWIADRRPLRCQTEGKRLECAFGTWNRLAQRVSFVCFAPSRFTSFASRRRATGWKPVFHDRLEAYLPLSLLRGLPPRAPRLRFVPFSSHWRETGETPNTVHLA